ncbi:MAG: cupredoxin domain-containing protein [Anaerolineae bacterium]|nr:cupredoxin domain-containing protein [Anaerolineae bacterium]MCI0608404.1 cupredoxin domain-containing protein [Anaerolineae bacterium]
MKKTIYLFIILLSLALSACQSGGPSTKLNVEMTDFAFTPNHFTVPAGEEITVNIAHHGIVVHEFIIMKPGTTAGENFDEEDKPNVYTIVEVPPGHSQTFTFTAPNHAGDYQIVCGIVGHLESGMIATLTVVE